METQSGNTVWDAMRRAVNRFERFLRAIGMLRADTTFEVRVEAVDDALRVYNAAQYPADDEVFCLAALTKNLQCETTIPEFTQTLLSTLVPCEMNDTVTMSRVLDAALKNKAILKTINRQLRKIDAIHRENIAVGEREHFKIYTYDFHPFVLKRIISQFAEGKNILDQDVHLFVSACRRDYLDYLEAGGETPSLYAPFRAQRTGRNYEGYNMAPAATSAPSLLMKRTRSSAAQLNLMIETAGLFPEFAEAEEGPYERAKLA